MIIKSISLDEQEIISNILKLHCNGGNIELDPTYSIGNFYKRSLKQPIYKFDIKPQIDGVNFANAESLPLEDNLINVIMFDPPFLATTGKSLKQIEGNIINKRFGVYPNENLLHSFYKKALCELYRVCKVGGILIFKCQDKVSGGKQYFSHCFIFNEAIKIGWYPKDLFILVAKNRLIANWQLNQEHARKFHSYFWVFKKSDKVINYDK